MGLSENDTELEFHKTFKELVGNKHYSEEKLLPIVNKYMSNTANLIDNYLDKKIGKKKVITYIDSLINVFENYVTAGFAEEFKNMFKGIRETFDEISKKFEEKGIMPSLDGIILEKIIIPPGYSKCLNCLNEENLENTINRIKEDHKKLLGEDYNKNKILVYPITAVDKNMLPSCVAIYCK